jgi:hypothetical protein
MIAAGRGIHNPFFLFFWQKTAIRREKTPKSDKAA